MALLMAVRRMCGVPVRAILSLLDSPFRKAHKMFEKGKVGRGRHALGKPGMVHRPVTVPPETRHNGSAGDVSVATTLLMNHKVEGPELPGAPLVQLRTTPSAPPEFEPEPPAAAGVADVEELAA